MIPMLLILQHNFLAFSRIPGAPFNTFKLLFYFKKMGLTYIRA